MIDRNTILGSYRKWKVGKDIRAILTADPKISAAVGSKVFPVIAPENTTGDFIVYKRERYSKADVKQGVYQDEVLIAVTVISDSYDAAADIADLVDLAAIGEHLTEEKKKIRIELDNAVEGYAENKYYQTLVLRVV